MGVGERVLLAILLLIGGLVCITLGAGEFAVILAAGAAVTALSALWKRRG